MGAFLLFVDNKTDIAVFMYILLALFLLIYLLGREEKDSKSMYIFLALSGFFF
jgi:hypothetical protein